MVVVPELYLAPNNGGKPVAEGNFSSGDINIAVCSAISLILDNPLSPYQGNAENAKDKITSERGAISYARYVVDDLSPP